MSHAFVLTPSGGVPYGFDMKGNSVNCIQHVTRSFSSPAISSHEAKQPRVRRTFKELNRELECPHNDCKRRYASRSSLATHLRLKHSPEAKQQQQEEEALKQANRRKSSDKPVTPRPVRPRTMGVMPVDMLNRQTIYGTVPLQLYSLPSSPINNSSVAYPLSSQSLTENFNLTPPPLCLEHPHTEPLSLLSPIVFATTSARHMASLMSVSPSPILSSASTPDLSTVAGPTIIDSGLDQAIVADHLDQLLLAHLDLSLSTIDMTQDDNEGFAPELQDMQALLQGLST